MKYFLVLFAVTVLCQYSQAQDTLLAKKYEGKTIQPAGGHFLIAGERFELTGLKPFFNQYPVPASEYKLYFKNQTKAEIISLSSLAMLVTGIIVYYQDPAEAEKHPAIVFTIYGAGLTSSVISGIFGSKARKHFQKALWVYNKEVLID